jgi:hypothetical protein
MRQGEVASIFVQCCGSGSGWILIGYGVLDLDPYPVLGVRIWIRNEERGNWPTNKPDFQPFTGTYVVVDMCFTLLGYVPFQRYFS